MASVPRTCAPGVSDYIVVSKIRYDYDFLVILMCNLGFWTPANAMLEIEDDIVDKMNVSRLLDEFMVGYDKERVPRRKWK